MAEAIISPIVEQLGSRAIKQLEQEVTLVFGVKKAVRKLKSNMESIQAVINDAEIRAQLITEEAVRVWVDKLKDVSYDIDDVLDEWSTAILKVKIDRAENPSSKVCFFIPASCCMFRQIIIRRDIAVKIKHLNGRLDEIAEEKNKYSFQPSTLPTISHSSQSSTLKNRKSTSIVDVKNIVGRVDEQKILIDMLLSESSHGSKLTIISVTGMGGLGKTTLAQLAYNDERICTHFEKKMWVCVSDPFEEITVAKAILEALTNSAPNLNELSKVMESINEEVQGKKFLLVLDDVWCEEYDWCRKLEDSLQTGSPGSKILITTRKDGVATAVGSTIFQLQVLGDEESLDLFKLVTFRDWTAEEREHLEEISDKIVEKCKGLPLAIKTISGYLRMKKSEREWRDVLGQGDLWRLKEEKGVFPLLLLSYNDLSPALRQCFLYCALFQKDCEIWKDYMMINLWMAQGYLVAENNREMEEVGDEYFIELAMRSFFQDFEKHDDGTIKYCKMHDIVHDFARSLTNNECLAMEVNGVEELNLETSSYANTRHLMMLFGRCAVSIPISLGNLKSLRTLKINHGWGATMSTSFDESFDKVIDQLTSLRTLDLSETKIEKLPRNIGKLLHLRYINLWGCHELKELPETVWDLCNLLVLDFYDCQSLKRLPGGLGKVINLRQLKLKRSGIKYLPRGFDRLTGLCYLDEFVVSCRTIDKNEVCTLSDLMNLNHLRGKLDISWLGDVREASEAKKANLNKKEHLTELCLSFNSRAEGEDMEESRDVEVLEALQPHPNLQTLFIFGYRGRMAWPSWMTSSLINLKCLKLYYYENCEVLPTLGKLPSLESLEIWKMKSVKRVGSELLGTLTSSASPTVFFPKLKTLEFYSMEEWEEWDYTIFTQDEEEESSDISTTSAIISIMPCLQRLLIQSCPKLKRVPDYILNTPSLQTFTIYLSPVLKEHMMKYFPDDSRLRYKK